MKNICTTVRVFFRQVFTRIDFSNTYTVLLSSNQNIPVHANTNNTNQAERLQQLFFIVFSLKIPSFWAGDQGIGAVAADGSGTAPADGSSSLSMPKTANKYVLVHTCT